MNLPIDIRSDSAVTVDQQKFNIVFLYPLWAGAVAVRQRRDGGAIAVRLRIDSRSDSSGEKSAERQWRYTGVIAV